MRLAILFHFFRRHSNFVDKFNIILQEDLLRFPLEILPQTTSKVSKKSVGKRLSYITAIPFDVSFSCFFQFTQIHSLSHIHLPPRIDVHIGVIMSRRSILTGVVHMYMKSYLEAARCRIYGRCGYQQMQVRRDWRRRWREREREGMVRER